MDTQVSRHAVVARYILFPEIFGLFFLYTFLHS